jgi:hypothetical protein
VSIPGPTFDVEDRVVEIGMGVYEAGRRIGSEV